MAPRAMSARTAARSAPRSKQAKRQERDRGRGQRQQGRRRSRDRGRRRQGQRQGAAGRLRPRPPDRDPPRRKWRPHAARIQRGSLGPRDRRLAGKPRFTSARNFRKERTPPSSSRRPTDASSALRTARRLSAGCDRARPTPASLAPVIVLDADDVVLAEIAAGLHLDQLEHDLARIFQPVHRAHRDVDRIRSRARS